MFKSVNVAVLLISVLVFSPSIGIATMISLEASLSGDQEAPPLLTTGKGEAQMTFDTGSFMFTWDLNYSDLESPASSAFFHFAPVGANGPVSLQIPDVIGLTGHVMGSSTLNSYQRDELLAGLWYINVHTVLFPAGEIRGQVEIAPVPEPSTFFLLGGGLAGLAFYARRKRKE